jgi:hypothetical protein
MEELRRQLGDRAFEAMLEEVRAVPQARVEIFNLGEFQ